MKNLIKKIFRMPRTKVVRNLEDAKDFGKLIDYKALIYPAYVTRLLEPTNKKVEYESRIREGLKESPITEVLIKEKK